VQPGVLCTGCGCDPSQLISRPIDDEAEHNIAVHRGTITSSELVVEDATQRDRLAMDDLLCFETEAAGFLADFPCIQPGS